MPLKFIDISNWQKGIDPAASGFWAYSISVWKEF